MGMMFKWLKQFVTRWEIATVTLGPNDVVILRFPDKFPPMHMLDVVEHVKEQLQTESVVALPYGVEVTLAKREVER